VDVHRTDLAPHRLLDERREGDQRDPLIGPREPQAAAQRLATAGRRERRERVARRVRPDPAYVVQPSRVDRVDGEGLLGLDRRGRASTLTHRGPSFRRKSDTAPTLSPPRPPGCADARSPADLT
jgi:hypothetical protein